MSEKTPSKPKLRMAETPEEQKAWMAQWRLAAEGLREVKRDELRALTDAEAIASFNALDMPPELIYRVADRAESPGFVEQQRFFQKARRH